MEVQPMPSTKIREGVYEVIGTSTGCTVERGWTLFSDGQIVRHFATKREALIYCQEHPEL